MNLTLRTHKRFVAGAFVATACTLLSGCMNTVMLVTAGVSTYYAGTHPEVISDDYLNVKEQRQPEAQLVLHKHRVSFPPRTDGTDSRAGQKAGGFLDACRH